MRRKWQRLFNRSWTTTSPRWTGCRPRDSYCSRACASLREALDRTSASADDLRELEELASTIESQWNRIDGGLVAAAKELRSPRPKPPQPADRQHLADALRYLLLPADLRADLFRQLRAMERELANARWTETPTGNELSQKQANGGIDPSSGIQPGIWHSLWILNILSLQPPSGFDDLVRQWRKALDSPDRQRAQLLTLGENVRNAWKTLRSECSGLQLRSQQPANFAGYEDSLKRSFRMAFLVHGYDASRLAAENVEPAHRLRLWRLMDQALFDCDRRLEGFWASVNGEDPPWFARVARESLEFIEATNREPGFNAKDELKQRRDLLEQRLAARLFLELNGRERIPFSLARNRQSVSVRLSETAGQLPRGTATLWLRSSAPNPVAIEGNGQLAPRPKEDFEFHVSVPAAAGDAKANCDPVALQPTVSFRGHSWESQRELMVEPCRDARTDRAIHRASRDGRGRTAGPG